MRFLKRRRERSPARDGGAAAATVERPRAPKRPPTPLPPLDELDARVAELAEVAPAGLSYEQQVDWLRVRNLAGVQVLEHGPDALPEHPEPLPAGLGRHEGLPEIGPQEVSPELLRAAILRDGCLFIRGLIPRDAALEMADGIDRAFAEREHHDAGRQHDPRLYTEFLPDSRYGDDLSRAWIKEGGGLLAVDSPKLSAELSTLLRDSGVVSLVTRYLGERPLTTAQKTTLRKAEPSVPGGWHQDGKFMGQVRAMNLWLSLSRCGDVAPGLDIVPRRLDGHVTTQTDEAMLDYMVSQRLAEEVAGDKGILRPIFEPGDALLFDELFLHKTGSDPAMAEPRYAVESWFFGASAFPAEYAPLSLVG